LPYQYQRTPFNPSQQAQMATLLGCHGIPRGAKDLFSNGLQFEDPVFAVEGGTVVFVQRNATCFSRPTPNPDDDPNVWELFDFNRNIARLTFNIRSDDDIRRASNMIPPECDANRIVVRGDDGFFTEYVHVLPNNNLAINSRVEVGDTLGRVDNSALVTGPHVHLARYRPNPNFDPNNPNVSPYSQNGGTCNWTMFNVVEIDITPRNGWVEDEDSRNWYYYVNGIRQTNQWILTQGTYYQVDSTGVYTGSRYFFDNTTQRWLWFDSATQRWFRWDGTTWVAL